MITIHATMMATGVSVLFSVLHCLVVGRGAAVGTRPPKTYVVNLDLPEEQRWVHVIQDHLDLIQDVHIMFRYCLSYFITIVIFSSTSFKLH